MNVRELEYFMEVCKQGSLNKAAQSLFISSQGLSKAVKSIEQEVGADLFYRSQRGMELTRYGKILFRNASNIIREYNSTLVEIEQAKELNMGKVRFLSAYGILRLLTPEFIFDFNKQHSNIELEYVEYPDYCVEKRLLKKEGDIGFSIGPIDKERFNFDKLFEYKICLLVNKEHPLAKKEVVSISDLKDQSIIIESNKFKIHTIIVEKCRERGFIPNIIFNTSGFSLCHKLCSQGLGLSVTVDFISNDMRYDNIKLIPFEENLKWSIYMIRVKDNLQSEKIDILKKYAKNWCKKKIVYKSKL